MTTLLKRLLDRCLRAHRPQVTLTPSQKRTYDSEAEENFRWLYSLLASKSPRVLTTSDLMDDEVHLQLSAIGQYAEISHGSISPSFVFQHLKELCSPGQPLEEYDVLRFDGARLVSHFKGEVADVQGYVAFRPVTHQLVIAFSGTSSSAQALKDMQVWRTPYPRDAGRSTVHYGFWKMYQGVRSRAYEALRLGFQEHEDEIRELALTGHSMGGAMSYLLALDLMADTFQEASTIPRGIVINLAVFGNPRLGNDGLARYWRRCIEEYISHFGGNSFIEYSIKAYNDGVPTLPLHSLGFRHLTECPLYFYHGRLYRIPASESEHGVFTVEQCTSNLTLKNGNVYSSPDPRPRPMESSSPAHVKPSEFVAWPRGGHNYYNDRDMEKLQRRMRWLNIPFYGEQGWQERYAYHLQKWEMKWGRDSEESVR